ncbi:hypothetical protein FNF31_00538 [Cafeteria roenbergensis]|uniref:Uncharacterized protein n=1 Tax=Cafeteria roenbergensis TaxID=33653 RepID=A0A5A8DS83_CAFRO|nr:hypothetical protein FNF31_00538 [Cafeteria roenbergensis]
MALVLRRTALHDHGTVSSRGASGEWDVAMVYGEADPRVLGIEVDKHLHEAACAALEAVAASREAGGGLPSAAEASVEASVAAKASFPAGCGWSAVELFLGDFRQSAALGDAGVVFVTATTFPPALMAALARACERLKPGAVVVSTGQRVVSPLLEDVGECRRAMPWGASTVYFSRRARGGRWLAGVLRR